MLTTRRKSNAGISLNSAAKAASAAANSAAKAGNAAKARKPTHKLYHEFPATNIYSSLKSLKDPRLKAEVQKWYKKLQQAGFQDIEKNPNIANGNYPTISGFYSLDATTNYNYAFDSRKDETKGEARYELYQMVSTYVAWLPPAINLAALRKKRILELYSDGKGAATISEAIKLEFGKKGNSVWTIHYEIKTWLVEVVEWNKTSENGLFYYNGE